MKPELSTRAPSELTSQPRDLYEQRYSLDFLDQDHENDFRQQFVSSQRTHIRIAIVVGVVLMIAFGAADTVLYYEEKNQLFLWFIRCGIITPMALLVIGYTYTTFYVKNSQYSGFLFILIVGSTWLFLLSNDGLHRSLYSMPNLIEAVVYSLFLVGLTVKFSIPLCIIFVLFYVKVITDYDLPDRMIISLAFSLLVIIGLLILCAYQKEMVTRALFIKSREEQRSAEKHAQEHQRDLNWLRSLAGFLRHEVRQPIALISSSLDIMQLIDTEKSIRNHVTNAETGIKHVWNLIDRATRATDAEAFVRQSQPEMVNLRDLTAEIVDGFRQTYSGVNFSYESEGSPTIFADAALIREAIVNLLSNAASFADDASTINVTIREIGRRAILSVINKGPPVDGDAEILFGPFRSTRVGEGNEHQGLGLYLVRLVAEHYQGTAKLSNLDNGEGVEASITLPLAASTKRSLQAIDSPELAQL